MGNPVLEVGGFITPNYFSAEATMQREVAAVVNRARAKAIWSSHQYNQLLADMSEALVEPVIVRLKAEGFEEAHYSRIDRVLTFGPNPYLGELLADAVAVVAAAFSEELSLTVRDHGSIRYLWKECPEHLKSELAKVAAAAGWQITFDVFDLKLLEFEPIPVPTDTAQVATEVAQTAEKTE